HDVNHGVAGPANNNNYPRQPLPQALLVPRPPRQEQSYELPRHIFPGYTTPGSGIYLRAPNYMRAPFQHINPQVEEASKNSAPEPNDGVQEPAPQ
ncbi:hypothetical protein J6590_107007, partial [Homalodisca vitripennis]